MTKLLSEDQTVPDNDAKKPAILKHHSIVLTDEELKELGMKDISNNNCEITEEEEYADNPDCEEKPVSESEVENPSTEKDVDDEGLSQDTNSNQDPDAKTDEMGECNNENSLENNGNNDELEENKIETEESNIESIENLPDSECNADVVETEIELVIEDNPPKEIAKPNEIKQNQLNRPISGHKFRIPPMWTPANPRANAAFVYIFFRHVSSL